MFFLLIFNYVEQTLDSNLKIENIANWQLEKSNERKKTKKNLLIFSKIFDSWISNKQLDALTALWICKTICDWPFSAWKFDNYFPFSKLEVDHVFRDLYAFAVR